VKGKHILNSVLNRAEYEKRKIHLDSFPESVFIQMDAPCNHDCVFCSRPENYPFFDIDSFRRDFGETLEPVFENVSRINLTGSGELLFLPEARRSLEYFNGFSHAGKMFATNGSSLTPKMADFLLESGSRYVIHISLHAPSDELHRKMTGAKTFQVILENLKHLKKARSGSGNLTLNFIFVATALNISALPDFVSFSSGMGADGVMVYYNYIYRNDQLECSCFHKQELANRMLEEAETRAASCGIDISLPPFFGRKYPRDPNPCREPWSQIMINSAGDVISCDVAGDSRENLKSGKSFMDIWNGKYYTRLRKNLAVGSFDCAQRCWRANPETVNEFISHIITRGRSEEEIEKLAREYKRV